MNNDDAYWVPCRVAGGRWIKNGPYRTREEALRERQNMKNDGFKVDNWTIRTSTEMDEIIESMNAGFERATAP
jgi:hypothetical protein